MGRVLLLLFGTVFIILNTIKTSTKTLFMSALLTLSFVSYFTSVALLVLPFILILTAANNVLEMTAILKVLKKTHWIF